MAEFTEHIDSYPDNVEFYASEEELSQVLEEISSAIGWVIIEFNSLEGSVGFCILEQIGNSNHSDEYAYIFLANTGFNAKYNILVNIYSRIIETCEFDDLKESLGDLDTCLGEAARRRNCYAHADWTEISTSRLVGVKLKVGRKGVRRVYRTFSPDDLQNDRAYIREAIEKLIEFDDEINERLATGSA